jgi:hypothetical protein
MLKMFENATGKSFAKTKRDRALLIPEPITYSYIKNPSYQDNFYFRRLPFIILFFVGFRASIAIVCEW